MIYDISLGFFAGAGLVLITSLGSYMLEKKRNIGLTKHYCSKYVIKLSTLVSVLQNADDDGRYPFNIDIFKYKIINDRHIYDYISNLLDIHEEQLINVEFAPLIRKSKKNLDVHKLITAFARINSAVQYFRFTYMKHHAHIFKAELEDLTFTFSDDELTSFLDIIMQSHGNNEYKHFFDLYKIVLSKDRNINAFTPGCNDKCL